MPLDGMSPHLRSSEPNNCTDPAQATSVASQRQSADFEEPFNDLERGIGRQEDLMQKLPPELRTQIYDLVGLTADFPIYIRYDEEVNDVRAFVFAGYGRDAQEYWDLSGLEGAVLLGVCKSIRAETLPMLYGSNTFFVNDNNTLGVFFASKHRAEHVRHIVLAVEGRAPRRGICPKTGRITHRTLRFPISGRVDATILARCPRLVTLTWGIVADSIEYVFDGLKHYLLLHQYVDRRTQFNKVRFVVLRDQATMCKSQRLLEDANETLHPADLAREDRVQMARLDIERRLVVENVMGAV